MMTDDLVDKMVKDANFVGPNHPYAPQLFDDLCCHIRALAAERKEIQASLRWMLDQFAGSSGAGLSHWMEIGEYRKARELAGLPEHPEGCPCDSCDWF